MRTIIAFLIGIAMMSLCGCGGEYSHELVVVDSLLNENMVGQAVSKLACIKSSDYKEQDLNYYRLLKVVADDKQYITHTTDTVISPVIKYYEAHGSEEELARVYYYGGSVFRDLGDAPQALDYFQKSHNILKTTGCNKRLEGVIYSQKGELYMAQHMYDFALKMYRESQKYSQEENDSVGMVHDYATIGMVYEKKEKYDSSEYYYKKALEMAEQLNEKRLVPMVNCLMLMLYTIDIHDYVKAKQCLDRCLHNHAVQDNANVANIAHVAAIYYFDSNNLDSAEIYSKEVIRMGDRKLVMNAYSRLSYIEMARNNPEKAMAYAEQYLEYRNAVEAQMQTEEMQRINAVYNYQFRERENFRLKAENERQQTIIAWSVVLFAILAFSVIYLLKYRQHKHKMALERLKQKEDEAKKRYTTFIEENNLKIAKLTKQLADISVLNDELRGEIERKKAALEAANEEICNDIKKRADAVERLSETTIFGRIQFVLRDKSKVLTAKDWHDIEVEVIKEYPKFKEELNTLSYRLTEQEYRVSLLLKLNLTPSEIASLICKTKESVTSIRRRLYNKVFDDVKGKPEYWDRFIMTL